MVISQLGVGKSTVPLPDAVILFCSAASPSRCLNVTDYFTAVRAREGGAEGEVKNLASASRTAGIPDGPEAAQKPEAGRDGWQVHLLGSKSHAQAGDTPAMVCQHPQSPLPLPSL